jgi:tRNA U34 5-methylaminomethyl-2-thiouridine-forming methyltransferase MnmC
MNPRHEPVLTEDGSPSLQTTYDNGIRELMHHFRGALTESIYVYTPAIEWGLRQVGDGCRILSLGLGLGYNELLSIGAALRGGRSIELITFEMDSVLRENFRSWLADELEDTNWRDIYDTILNSTAKALDLSPGVTAQTLKCAAQNLIQTNRWSLRGAFPDSLNSGERFHVLLYDAFSAKMNEPLWLEESLFEFLNQHAAPSCVFATYAATGRLKRALKRAGFQQEFKAGFGGKKESTFAVRFD